jgi:glycine C-acetyltransferase/8-amino-7-oxononanoate synthase
MSLEEDLRQHLDHLRLSQRIRSTRSFEGPDRAHPHQPAGSLLAFCSNDYLGLANHPALAEAAADAVRDHGFGSGASRLISGESPLHGLLEHELAEYTHFDSALLFPSGYQTNIGVVTALAGTDDLIVSDAANHASIIDGCRLSRARIMVYAHTDPEAAARALATPGTFRRRVLITESVFSMDGDRAPLADLAFAARSTDAIFIVDEAHALGIAGPNGRGLCVELGVQPTVLVGTLGKAFGSAGGFAACTPTIRSYLLNTARTFIFTTASPHPVVAASLAAVRLLTSASGDALRTAAYSNAEALRSRLSHAGPRVPGRDLILPWIVGTDRDALDLSAHLAHSGIVVPAIRPPTVPEGTARLRITVSAAHTAADVNRLADCLLQNRPTP